MPFGKKHESCNLMGIQVQPMALTDGIDNDLLGAIRPALCRPELLFEGRVSAKASAIPFFVVVRSFFSLTLRSHTV
jgi:hypothetical protein